MTQENKVDDDSYTMDKLIEDGICPPYLVPSKSYLKRCLPSIVEAPDGTDVNNETVIVDGGDIPGGDDILAGDIQDAMGYVAKLINARGIAEKAFADIRDSGWFILAGLIIGMVLAFVWIILMRLSKYSSIHKKPRVVKRLHYRFVAAVMIWTSLVLSVALLTLSCVYCFFKYDSLKNDPDSQASITEIGMRISGQYNHFEPFILLTFAGFTTDLSAYTELANFWLTFFIISVVALVIILLILIFLRNRFDKYTDNLFMQTPSKKTPFSRLRIAIELIEEGSIAVGDIMSTLFFPVVPFLMQLVVIAAPGWCPHRGAFGSPAACIARALGMALVHNAVSTPPCSLALMHG